MATDGTYQGWANRETWALALWLNNDQGLYEAALDTAEDALMGAVERHEASDEARVIGDALKLWVTDDLFGDESPLTGELRMMRDEVGSLWRIDWDEIGAAFIPSEHGR
jgi:hypothetical protein